MSIHVIDDSRYLYDKGKHRFSLKRRQQHKGNPTDIKSIFSERNPCEFNGYCRESPECTLNICL